MPQQKVELICNSAFKFCAERMADDDDRSTIMFAYFGKIKPKNSYLNSKTNKDEDSTSELRDNQ